ncbi:Uncharacterised protein r2_g1858 [Pycnogonum litorale]
MKSTILANSLSEEDKKTDSKETQEFLTEERNAAMELLQEKCEMQILKFKLRECKERCRLLLEAHKLKDSNHSLDIQRLRNQMEFISKYCYQVGLHNRL